MREGEIAMFEFTKEHEMIRAMVREFADTELGPKALELDSKGEFPFELVRKIGALGIIGVACPREYGGSKAGHLPAVIAVEEIARVYPSLAFILEVTQAPLYMIENYGTPEQKQAWLPPLIRGEMIAAVAATEPTGGSDLATLNTTAVADGDVFILNGRKVYITNGSVGDIVLVLAKTGERASILAVEKGTPGLVVSRRQELMGFKSGDVCELGFSSCRIPKKNIIGKEGGGQAVAMATFTVSRAAVGAVGLGIARGAFEIALKYAKERSLYGKPIAGLQAIQFMLVDMDTEIDAARWLIYHPAACLDRGMLPRDIGKLSARAKYMGGEVAASVTLKAMQVLGGYGVSPEYHLARLLADAVEIFPATGTPQIMKIIQAMEIVK
jgi:alkylation response protein AidB-like acyl-CoA dehydrogenase